MRNIYYSIPGSQKGLGGFDGKNQFLASLKFLALRAAPAVLFDLSTVWFVSGISIKIKAKALTKKQEDAMLRYYKILGLHNRHRKKIVPSTKAEAVVKPAFIQSPSKGQLGGHFRQARGDCVKACRVNKIRLNRLSVFRLGDPLRFKGKATGIVEFSEPVVARFLKIKVYRLPETFIYVAISKKRNVTLRQCVL